MLSQAQEAFFRWSKVRDACGVLMPMYHGTGTTITEFDPKFTARGNDQYGSGFYFTSSRTLAESYSTSADKDEAGVEMEKIGGCDNPNVVEAYLNIVKPIVVDGAAYADLRHITVTSNQAFHILLRQPDLFQPPCGDEDSDPNPLGDYFEDFWAKKQFTQSEYRRFIRRLADVYFAGSNLKQLDFFFGVHGTEFRTAVRDVLGFDGVVVQFANGSWHAVAWFPNQIKAISNVEPTGANGIFQ